MARPRICAVITTNDISAIKDAQNYADLLELRIDLIGAGWEQIPADLSRPWIACCRSRKEGVNWKGSEAERIGILASAAELGAAMVDIELSTASLEKAVLAIKKSSLCLISFHDFKGTPPLAELEKIVKRQIAAGAYTCKVITTAKCREDNLTVLSLISKFHGREIVAFAMGEQGILSRILCPLVGGSFTYASAAAGKESAAGQITASELRKIYDMVKP
jgi:3-dehydroquinate dehydratase I